MMYKKVLGLSAIAATSLAAVSFAQQVNLGSTTATSTTAKHALKGQRQVENEAIKTAVTNNDYSAFQTAASGTMLAQKITSQDLFTKYVQLENLRTQAQALAKELGLDQGGEGRGHGGPDGSGGMAPHGNGTEFKAIKAAVTADDYTAFTSAVANTPLADSVNTQAKFETFVAMNKALQDGDTDSAKKLADSLGLPQPRNMKEFKKDATALTSKTATTTVSADASAQ